MPLEQNSGQLTQIIAAQGNGGDIWVQTNPNIRKGPEDLLLVKKSSEQIGFDRQIRLRFDLRNLSDQQHPQDFAAMRRQSGSRSGRLRLPRQDALSSASRIKSLGIASSFDAPSSASRNHHPR
ncbi:hypothetical protein [Rhodopirellula sp. P2]|uniref:hypothetical protein n=1 Tax=Rhodopirellula sp. P2 TaxID=2127060 RepID=UPI002368C28A|nr:hypothetical protein [Rhodopirellula sp. P2]WDQ17814.1 hypothetical protein PSR62_04495 [Rhodopirellula sp. P2]